MDLPGRFVGPRVRRPDPHRLPGGFIRAETIRWDGLLDEGSWVRARESGLVRSEGKDYRPEDGDVMEFLFNV